MKRATVSSVVTTIATITLATTQSLQASSTISASEPQCISVPVYFVSATGEQLPTASFPSDLVIELGVISGSVGGVDAPLETYRIRTGNDFLLDLSALTAKVSQHAARFREAGGAPLELTPAETRFARVSTGASTGAGPLAGLAVVFWDVRANGSLVPLYCDRPCSLRAPKSDEQFDFDAPVPGLGWMLTKVRTPGFVHVGVSNPRPVIVIAPPEAFEKITPSTFKKRRS
jgi:hypothetical protein